jgi:hypothetical protein
MRAVTFTCAVALALALAPGARADENDRLTYMTFSGPVQIPGVTLAAGTYTFKLADTQSNRHVVQVFTKDDNKLITTLMTIPNERLEPVKDTFVMFSERPAGTPVAVKAWFYPGRSIGEEFLYPRQQAIKIAKAVHQPVLTTDGDEATTSGSVARVNDAGRVTPVNDSSTTANNATTTAATTTANGATTTASRRAAARPAAPVPEAESAAVNQSTTTAGRATTTARSRPAVGTAGQATTAGQSSTAPAPRQRLPRTASPIALFELLSGLSLAAGFGVRQLRKHS